MTKDAYFRFQYLDEENSPLSSVAVVDEAQPDPIVAEAVGRDDTQTVTVTSPFRNLTPCQSAQQIKGPFPICAYPICCRYFTSAWISKIFATLLVV